MLLAPHDCTRGPLFRAIEKGSKERDHSFIVLLLAEEHSQLRCVNNTRGTAAIRKCSDKCLWGEFISKHMASDGTIETHSQVAGRGLFASPRRCNDNHAEIGKDVVGPHVKVDVTSQ